MNPDQLSRWWLGAISWPDRTAQASRPGPRPTGPSAPPSCATCSRGSGDVGSTGFAVLPAALFPRKGLDVIDQIAGDEACLFGCALAAELRIETEIGRA